MDIRYHIDAETGQPQIYRHGVQEADEQVLERAGENRAGREGSRLALGRTVAGRYLKVVYVPDPEADSAFVITAYELTGKPLRAYKRRMRRRNR